MVVGSPGVQDPLRRPPTRLTAYTVSRTPSRATCTCSSSWGSRSAAVSSASPTELATRSRCICRFRPTTETCPRSSAPASAVQGTLEHLTGCATLAVRPFHNCEIGSETRPSSRASISRPRSLRCSSTDGELANRWATDSSRSAPRPSSVVPSMHRSVPQIGRGGTDGQRGGGDGVLGESRCRKAEVRNARA